MPLDYKPPNPRLALELEQVARDAHQVMDSLRGLNQTPKDFPSEAITEICLALENLRNGTAEGCNEPLTFARYMLPLVRRDHFHIEGEEPVSEDEDEVFFIRDHQLDRAITRLYGAVGTALDEYRAQAQDKYDDRVGAEEMITLGQDGSFADIDKRSKAVTKEFQNDRETFDEMRVPGSQRAHELSSQLSDGVSLGHEVQAQLRIRPIAARFYKAAAAAIRKLPDALSKTADGIRLGVDIAEIWIEGWARFNKRLRNTGYETWRDLANMLDATANRARAKPKSPGAQVEKQRDPDVVAAETLVKEMLLAGKEIPRDLAVKVEQLVFQRGGGKIQRPIDLSRLTGLKSLILGDAVKSLSDLRFISASTGLTELKISDARAHNLADLGHLSSLTSLSVMQSHVRDLSGLEHLKQLSTLSLQVNKVHDLSALGFLTELSNLSLQANSASDLSALGCLTKLTTLRVQANNASEVSAIGQLLNVSHLSVQARSAQRFPSLEKLVNLLELKIDTPEIDLNILMGLDQLGRLQLTNVSELDLAPLATLPNLKHVRLANVGYRNLDLLDGLEVETVGGS